MGIKSVLKSNEQYIKECRLIHGDYYDYSKTKYNGAGNKVIITCPIHGDFEQKASHHLSGHGCKHCTYTTSDNHLILGVGINDCNESSSKPSIKWRQMLERCYSTKLQKREPTYKDCTICEEWLILSNFKKWFEDPVNGYKDGYELDKDILIKGNKVYSPSTCCFVPHKINQLLVKKRQRRSNLPIGVYYRKDINRFQAKVNIDNRSISCGCFNCIEAAFNSYKICKEKYLRDCAQKYFSLGLITEKVYEALLKYEVEITD